MYQCQLHLALFYSGLLLGSAPLIFWFPPNLIPWALLCQSFPCFVLSLSWHWLASVAFSLGQLSLDLKQTSLFLKLPPSFLFKNVFHLSQNFQTHHVLSFSICSISSHLLLHSQHSKPWSYSCQLYGHFPALPAYFLVASETTGNMLLLGIVSPLGLQDNLFSWFSLFALSASSQSPSWPPLPVLLL